MRPEFETCDINFLSQPENYGAFVAEVHEELNLPLTFLCERFSMSVPTVRRHMAGESMPISGARELVVGYLCDVLKQTRANK